MPVKMRMHSLSDSCLLSASKPQLASDMHYVALADNADMLSMLSATLIVSYLLLRCSDVNLIIVSNLWLCIVVAA